MRSQTHPAPTEDHLANAAKRVLRQQRDSQDHKPERDNAQPEEGVARQLLMGGNGTT